MSDPLPSLSVSYPASGRSTRTNAMGMRPMQERCWLRRGEQHLLIKSPPASGKSRALMFLAIDKVKRQGLKQAIVVVPERTIGASFADEDLSAHRFAHDWKVEPRWNLCNAPGDDEDASGGKVDAVEAFLQSDAENLICTHATFRFAADRLGVEAFDRRLVAIDEFHHVSASPDSRLGEHVRALLERDRAHLIAMTGSYFRGDAAAVLHPEDEARFTTVTYTYYEQLAGYEHLLHLDIGHYFYTGSYADGLAAVLDPAEKTIVHIPNVNARESLKDKIREVEHVLENLGEWKGTDPATGFQLIETSGGRTLKVADLVDDDPAKRERVAAALKDPTKKHDRDHVDVIVALGMAKEGFDWVWCEHALTIGYRASLTEVVQIIGRTTRDAPGKARARFTNLIAEPDASEQKVAEAVNDTLKAIAASLLMEQVLQPRFEFSPKNAGPKDGFDYGPDGYDPDRLNIGMNEQTGACHVEISGLKMPHSEEAKRICQEDVAEIVTSFVQDKPSLERGMFDQELIPEELTQARLGKIIQEKYPQLDGEDQEAVRQQAIAAVNLLQQGKRAIREGGDAGANTALVDGVRRFALDVRELDVDLIDRINPFGEAYAILAKSMSAQSLAKVQDVITAKRVRLTPDEAREYARRALRFKNERGRLPELSAQDAWERKMAEGVAYLARMKAEADA